LTCPPAGRWKGKSHIIVRYETIMWIGMTAGNLPDGRQVASKK
jgi:hypothetical protein